MLKNIERGRRVKVPGRGFPAAEYAGPVDSGQVDRVCTILRYVLKHIYKKFILKASNASAATREYIDQ